MLEKFREHINGKLPFLREKKLLLTISGGIDSVVLTHLAKEIGLKFSLAHCNFNLRGAESDGDEDFIVKLSDKWDLEVFVQHFDTKTFAKENQLSTQVAARDLRYDWFSELAEQLKFDYILTAHHLDDNLETFLINFSRGTGLDGLTGIPEINGNIVRPVLPFSREQIEVYGIENNLKWRDDSTNSSTDYLRNKLRHDVIPSLKNITPQLLSNFEKTRSHLQEIAEIVDDRIDDISEFIIKKIDNDSVEFNIEQIMQLNNPKIYVYQLFKEYNFKEWDDVFNLLSAQSGKVIYSPGYRLLKDRNHLILSRVENRFLEDYLMVEDEDKIVNLPEGEIHFSKENTLDKPSKYHVHLDFEKLTYPMVLRKWQIGDYFYPLGLGGKKKIGKFFKDEKFSILEKEKTWLLTSDEKIVWIVGHRIDERFKVTAETAAILKAEYITIKKPED